VNEHSASVPSGRSDLPEADKRASLEQADAQKKLHDLLATMWEQRKGAVLDRLHVLEDSISSLSESGDGDCRAVGADAAHKLAGILGTFGLPRGTDLAREAEVTLEKESPLTTEDIDRLRFLARELGLLIAQRSLPGAR